MNRSRGYLGTDQSGTDLHETARIPRRYPARAGVANVGQLWREHRVRGLRLDQIVDSRAAAALIGIVERHEIETRNSGENGERRQGHALRVLQMTGRVVCDSNWKRSPLTRSGSGQQLAYIANPRAQSRCSLVPVRVILQQVSILFHG